jgi:hypothetical protein
MAHESGPVLRIFTPAGNFARSNSKPLVQSGGAFFAKDSSKPLNEETMNKKFWTTFLILSALNVGYMVYAEASLPSHTENAKVFGSLR